MLGGVGLRFTKRKITESSPARIKQFTTADTSVNCFVNKWGRSPERLGKLYFLEIFEEELEEDLVKSEAFTWSVFEVGIRVKLLHSAVRRIIY